MKGNCPSRASAYQRATDFIREFSSRKKTAATDSEDNT
jgi:hypothetical protein